MENQFKRLSRKVLALRGGQGEDDVFAKAKEERSPAVVTIEIIHPRNFGLNFAMSSQATGFVVDKERGIICSNKHVVHEGPCRAKARFMKHEEIDLLPVYRDPEHDFGFFTYDPSLVTETPKVEIEMDPEGATRGRNALIIGNNGGERLSFVPTTVSRTDRPPVPFLDMNTFYITASDTGVGGSSGAPLLSTEGKAIAMMAAGNDRTNISMYLPLFRVARALEYLREKKPIPRGTIQTGFTYSTFDALIKRKAVNEEQVKSVKETSAKSEGLLVVEKNLPKGPGKLAGIQNGDVLYKINGTIVFNYVGMEEIVDTFVGKEIDVIVIRDQKEIALKPIVQDLEEISLTRMVEVSNGIFHAIPYKVAAHVNQAIEGVFVASEGYMFRSVPRGSIVKKIGKAVIHDLDDFIHAIQNLDNSEVVSVRYQPLHDQNKVELATITVDKRWYPFQLATRNDDEGKWFYQTIEDIAKRKSLVKKLANQTTGEGSTAPKATKGDTVDPEIANLANSIVQVKYSIPFNVDGGWGGAGMSSVGVIVDKTLGLVITNRHAISTTLVDVQLIFNSSKTIHAKPLFIHPEMPLTVLKYDPLLLDGDRTVTVAEVKISAERPHIGEKLSFVGVNGAMEIDIQEVKVTNFRDVDYFGGEMMGHTTPTGPFEAVGLSNEKLGYGVYVDKDSKQAKALSIMGLMGGKGVVASDVYPIITELQEAVGNNSPVPGSVRMLPITTAFMDLAEARINELSDEWAMKLQASMTLYQKKLIMVKRRMVTTDAYDKLLENDVLLSVEGEVITLMREFYDITRGKEKVKLHLLRDYEEIEVEVNTTSFSTLGTTRIVFFGGLIVQDPHSAIYYMSTPENLKDGGVYVTHMESGSPAEAALYSDMRQQGLVGSLIFKVNGKPTRNLEDFLEAMKECQHNEFVRVVTKDIKTGEESVTDIRLDFEYWKSRDMWLDEHGDWQSKLYEHDAPKIGDK